MPPDVLCGRPPCLAERIETSLKEQNKTYIDFIERMFKETSGNIIKRLDDLGTEFDGVFSRLREAEKEISIIKDRQVGKIAFNEEKSKADLSIGQINDRLANIEDQLFTKEDVQKIMSTVEWVVNKTKLFNAIIVGVLILLIVGLIGWGLFIFDIHGRPGGQEHPSVKQEQVK